MSEASLAKDADTPGGVISQAVAEVLGGVSALTSAVVAMFRVGRVPAPPADTLESYLGWAESLDGGLDETDVDELRARVEWFRDIRARARQPLPEPASAPPIDVAVTAETGLETGLASLDLAPTDSGQPLPPEIDSLAAAATAPANDAPPTIVRVPGRAELEAREAAERFCEWLRLTGRMGTRTSAQLTDDYAEHCHAEDLVPVFEPLLRREMTKVRGVSKVVLKGQKRTGHGGSKRHRPVEWRIDALATVSTIPFDLPTRRAA